MSDKASENIVDFLSWFAGLFRTHYFNRHHLIIRNDEGTWHINLVKHDEYIELVNEALEKLWKKHKPSGFIEKALMECRYCNFLIFQCRHPTKFIQFWLGDNEIKLNFPMNKNNQLGQYKYQVLGIMAEMGFMRSYTKNKKLLPYYLRIESIDKGNEIVANFSRDIKLAAKFTSMVISQIFKEDMAQIKTDIG